MTKVDGRPSRDETFWKVLNAALELDFRKGHLKWTMSELSRKSSITRSLIYYHFGRSKSAILTEAVRVIGEEIIGIAPDRMELWKVGDWAQAIQRGRSVTQQSPYLVNFYMVHRDRPTDVGEGLRKLETRYMKKLGDIFPKLTEAELRILFGIFFGMIFAPLVNNEAIDAGMKALKSLLKP
ncbi:MAG TPA: TetR/AcrR family transcriptional regulator [Bdellovibrionales bacterium]|nr:TetR/AcrR family transcriptional regulator [Bdellovibrionales bacterium]